MINRIKSLNNVNIEGRETEKEERREAAGQGVIGIEYISK